MVLATTEHAITSTSTPHTARRVAVCPGGRQRWRCTWLPYRSLDRNQAITAMTVAELAPTMLRGVALDVLAGELGLTGPDALAAVLRPPHILDTRFHVLSLACWCEPTSAFDGHRNADGTEPQFEAMAGDPIDAAGFALEDPR